VKTYFEDVHAIFSVENAHPRDKVLMGMLASLGIEKGKPYNPDAKTKKARRQAVIDAYYYMADRMVKPTDPNRGWWKGKNWYDGLFADPNRMFTFENMDFNGRFINLKRSIVRGKVETPKSGKSRRVDINIQLTEALKGHRLESKKKGFELGLGGLPDYVFTNEKGTFLDKNNWRKRVFYKALEKAELRQIRVHDMRHTYATLRISKGDNITDVSKQLGHHSVKLPLDIYYHWFPSEKRQEVDALDDPEFKNPSAPRARQKQK